MKDVTRPFFVEISWPPEVPVILNRQIWYIFTSWHAIESAFRFWNLHETAFHRCPQYALAALSRKHGYWAFNPKRKTSKSILRICNILTIESSRQSYRQRQKCPPSWPQNYREKELLDGVETEVNRVRFHMSAMIVSRWNLGDQTRSRDDSDWRESRLWRMGAAAIILRSP